MVQEVGKNQKFKKWGCLLGTREYVVLKSNSCNLNLRYLILYISEVAIFDVYLIYSL